MVLAERDTDASATRHVSVARGDPADRVPWHPVTSWIIIALLAGIVGVGFAVTRFRRSRGGSLFDLGEVSQTWITEQRVDKRSDR
jgi:hypothetical protein